MRRPFAAALLAATMVPLAPGTSLAADIDACKYVVVTPLARDRFRVVNHMREQAAALGFLVIEEAADAPPADTFRVCVVTADWLGDETSGELAMQVMDAVTGTPIAVARVRRMNWFGTNATVRNGIRDLFEAIGYTGYSEEAYRARMERLYPPRPKIAPDEAERAAANRVGITGIWSDPDEQYRLAIIPAAAGSEADYIAVVLSVSAPLWEPGEVKAEFTRGDAPDRFDATYYLLNKQPVTLTFALQSDRLTATLSTPGAATEIALLRVSQ